VARAGARPRALTLADLEQARALYVTSALRGRQPATLAGRGAEIPTAREAPSTVGP
jgi:branched-subunit amino acid aminotransferase/4-amino-4-deoxychorismate lyase